MPAVSVELFVFMVFVCFGQVISSDEYLHGPSNDTENITYITTDSLDGQADISTLNLLTTTVSNKLEEVTENVRNEGSATHKQRKVLKYVVKRPIHKEDASDVKEKTNKHQPMISSERSRNQARPGGDELTDVEKSEIVMNESTSTSGDHPNERKKVLKAIIKKPLNSTELKDPVFHSNLSNHHTAHQGVSNATNEEKLFTGNVTKEDETLFELSGTTENDLFDISDNEELQKLSLQRSKIPSNFFSNDRNDEDKTTKRTMELEKNITENNVQLFEDRVDVVPTAPLLSEDIFHLVPGQDEALEDNGTKTTEPGVTDYTTELTESELRKYQSQISTLPENVSAIPIVASTIRSIIIFESRLGNVTENISTVQFDNNETTDPMIPTRTTNSKSQINPMTSTPNDFTTRKPYVPTTASSSRTGGTENCITFDNAHYSTRNVVRTFTPTPKITIADENIKTTPAVDNSTTDRNVTKSIQQTTEATTALEHFNNFTTVDMETAVSSLPENDTINKNISSASTSQITETTTVFEQSTNSTNGEILSVTTISSISENNTVMNNDDPLTTPSDTIGLTINTEAIAAFTSKPVEMISETAIFNLPENTTINNNAHVSSANDITEVTTTLELNMIFTTIDTLSGVPETANLSDNDADDSDYLMFGTDFDMENEEFEFLESTTRPPYQSYIMKIPKHIQNQKEDDAAVSNGPSVYETEKDADDNVYLIYETAPKSSKRNASDIPSSSTTKSFDDTELQNVSVENTTIPNLLNILTIPPKSTTDKSNTTAIKEKETCACITRKIFNSTANFSIEVIVENSSMCLPPNTYVWQDMNIRQLNFTWSSNVSNKNHSLSLILPKDEDSCKSIQLSIVEDNHFKIWLKNETKCTQEKEQEKVTMELAEDVKINFFNSNFFSTFKSREKYIKSDTLSSTEKDEQRKFHIELSVGICLILVVLASIFYYVVKKRQQKKKTKENNIHLENKQTHL